VVRATAADAARVRAVRLCALEDSPDAFGSTLAENACMSPMEWIHRLADPAAATFLAVIDGADVGMVVGRPHDEHRDAAGLYGMWVAPDRRREGLGRELIEAVLGWARAVGYRRIYLDVADGNAAAVATYAALGFALTGRTGTLPPPRDHVLEHERCATLD
jgi:GNAT superfamily N-acetyltransferase